jgi:translation initiation factor 4E
MPSASSVQATTTETTSSASSRPVFTPTSRQRSIQSIKSPAAQRAPQAPASSRSSSSSRGWSASGPISPSLITEALQPKQSHSAKPHPLKYVWTVSFTHRAPGQKIVEDNWAVERVASFGSVESFWGVWSHLKRPSGLPFISDYYVL